MNRSSVQRGAVWGILGAALSAALAACEVGPNYKRPPQDMGDAYKSAATQPATGPATQPASALGRNWWQLFGDPRLNELEAAAVEANPNVQAAMARVVEARAAADITKAQFYPSVTFDPSVMQARSLTNGGPPPLTGALYNIPFDMSYEVDVWGRIRRSYEASVASYKATANDFEVVLQTLEADVAQDYFNLRALDLQSRILRDNVEAYRKEVGLLETEYKTGLVTRLDVVQEQALLDATVTQQVELERQREDQEHALAILLGKRPAELQIEDKPLDLAPPVIPVGMPADLLRRRPDVAEAEQNLIAASAQVGVAKSAFFPAISLTGSAGFQSMDVQHALNWPNRVWSIGPSVVQPIFEGGILKAGMEQARAHYVELAATYRNTVLGAINDAEVALTDIHRYADEVQAQQRAVASSEEYLRLSEVQYKQGLVNYLTVIDAQRTVLTNELTEAQLFNSRLAATVALVKAVGGGWDAQSKEAVNPALPSTQPATQPTTRPATQAVIEMTTQPASQAATRP